MLFFLLLLLGGEKLKFCLLRQNVTKETFLKFKVRLKLRIKFSDLPVWAQLIKSGKILLSLKLLVRVKCSQSIHRAPMLLHNDWGPQVCVNFLFLLTFVVWRHFNGNMLLCSMSTKPKHHPSRVTSKCVMSHNVSS